MSKEIDVIAHMERIYETHNISTVFLVLGKESCVDSYKLERLLWTKNYPVNHSLFIIDEDDVDSISESYKVDLLVYVGCVPYKDYGCKYVLIS